MLSHQIYMMRGNYYLFLISIISFFIWCMSTIIYEYDNYLQYDKSFKYDKDNSTINILFIRNDHTVKKKKRKIIPSYFVRFGKVC